MTMWLQPRCGFPYEHEVEKRAALQLFATESGVSLSSAKQLKGLAPHLLRDAGYGTAAVDKPPAARRGSMWLFAIRRIGRRLLPMRRRQRR